MAIKNTATVYVDGINYTHYLVMPVKWGNLLDEQLDECYISLRQVPIKNFKPFTPVEIEFKNELYWGDVTDTVHTETKKYIVANDGGAVECPVGSGYWNHDLYLIEITKIAECIVVDTLTFTNDLFRNSLDFAPKAIPTVEEK